MEIFFCHTFKYIYKNSHHFCRSCRTRTAHNCNMKKERFQNKGFIANGYGWKEKSKRKVFFFFRMFVCCFSNVAKGFNTHSHVERQRQWIVSLLALATGFCGWYLQFYHRTSVSLIIISSECFVLLSHCIVNTDILHSSKHFIKLRRFGRNAFYPFQFIKGNNKGR